RGARLVYVVEHDLVDLPALRRDVTGASLLERLLELGVGDFNPARVFGRNERNDHGLAVLGRAKLALALLEIRCERFRRGSRDLASLRAIEQHIFDGPLFVLIAIRRLDRGLRRHRRTDDRVGKLGAQHPAALLRDVARLGVAVLTQDRLEKRPVELAVRAPERGIEPDPPRDLGVADAKSHGADTFIKKDLCENLPHYPAI